jgi:hypothetical protein
VFLLSCYSYETARYLRGATIGLVGFNVKVTITGGRAVLGTYGTVPDGQFEVAGSGGPSREVLSLTRRDPEGRKVQVVTSVNYGKGP